MTLRVVGAGLGRTGTMSLKYALERLLGAPCYHMMELFEHPEHIAIWHAAARGEMPNWNDFLSGYAAAVDWPVASFWPELSSAFPDALVLLSVRDSESWWRSARTTIFPGTVEATGQWGDMIHDLFGTRFTLLLKSKHACITAYEHHIERVRNSVATERLLEWQASDGWNPLCSALRVGVPTEPFPHVNTTKEFLADHASS